MYSVGTMGLSWNRKALSPMLNVGGGYYCMIRGRAQAFCSSAWFVLFLLCLKLSLGEEPSLK